jgi:soluble lytic murein transglycosylase
LALQNGKLPLAKRIAGRIADVDEKDLKLLDVANQTPKALLDEKTTVVKSGRKKTVDKISVSFKSRTGIEVNLFALDRLARSNVSEAVNMLEQLQNKFNSTDRAFAWSRVAYHAARTHNPQALEYYALAKNTGLDKEQLAWKVRAALREQNWDIVDATISLMPLEQQQEGAWRYWKARALNKKGLTVEANKILGPLSTERHYYGWLAAEDVESTIGNVDQEYKVSDVEITEIASQPAIKRSLELQKLGMRWEAKAEWVWATRNFDDKQLLAAAAYAMRQEWYDIAIATADNTKQLHDFNLRYPTPYRDLFRTAAENEGVDEAWIYGLARQESRFMHHAKSGVGAAGLMQIMPATAKWVAKRIGMSGYSSDLIHDLTTNVSIGTHYIRYTFELMNGQAVMATAAYNAGPSRAKRWLASEPMEAAVYIETIPFAETRSYVQKVMANAQMYAPRLGRSVLSLKSRLGVIPGTNLPELVVAESDEE